MFNLEDQEQVIESPDIQTFKNDSRPTMVTQSLTPRTFPIHPPTFSSQKFTNSPNTAEDNSLEQEIFQTNAKLLKKGVLGYLKHCLGQQFNQFHAVSSSNLFYFQNHPECEEEEELLLDIIISKNQLLNKQTQSLITDTTRTYPEIKSFLQQINPIFGIAITKEFVYLIASILTPKLQGYKDILDKQVLDLIPQMERFWGDQGHEHTLPSGWEVYQEIDYNTIKKFAVTDIEKLASKLYFAPELKYLTLREISGQLEGEQTNLIDKFTSLVTLFSESLFLSMSGMIHSEQDLEEYRQQLNIDLSAGGEIKRVMGTKRTKLQ